MEISGHKIANPYYSNPKTGSIRGQHALGSLCTNFEARKHVRGEGRGGEGKQGMIEVSAESEREIIM